MKKGLSISIKNVKKVYQLRSEYPTLAGSVLGAIKNTEFVALDNLNLDVKKGEKLGLIGMNGAGKTTLLKIISGIATPTNGSVNLRGKLVSLIDLGAGFHPELTGRENIELNGVLIGMSVSTIKKKMKTIIKFAGIDNFIDSVLYTYSSGMKLRLAFSIAIASDPDILILDEGIKVGDKNFRVKALREIEKLISKDKTVIIASHWLRFLEKNCNRIIWLEKGQIKFDGGIEVCKKYGSYRYHL